MMEEETGETMDSERNNPNPGIERSSYYTVGENLEYTEPLLQRHDQGPTTQLRSDSENDSDSNTNDGNRKKEIIEDTEMKYKIKQYSDLEFEDALKLLTMGKHQIRQFLLLALTGFIGSLHMLSAIFICAAPIHRCYIPALDINGSYIDVWSYDHIHDIFPYDEVLRKYSSCEVYSDINVSYTDPKMTWDTLKHSHISGRINGNSSIDPKRGIEKCKEYLYDRSTYSETIVTEWQLVCDSSYIRSLTESLFMAGVLVGAFVFGITSDKYGRKFTLCFSLVLQFTFGILSALMPNVETFCVSRFIEGCAISGVYLTAFVMGNEMVLPQMRTIFGVLFHLPGTFGALALGAFAYYIRNWRFLEIALTLPGAFLLFYYWLIDDSVRWLMANGKHEKAEKIFRRAAYNNNIPLPEEFSLKRHKCETDQASMLDLVRTPNLRKNALIIFYSWFVSSLVFYAIQLNIEGLPGDDYINFTISVLVEFPVIPICLYFMGRVGRRPTLLTAMSGAAFTCAMVGFIPKDYHGVIITLAMIGKVCVSITFTASYQYSVEAFPTVTRNAGIGASSMFARVGGILAPFIILMEESSRWLPYAILSVTALVAAFLTFFLPETRGKHLPETIAEGEEFGRDENRSLTVFFTRNKRHAKMSSSTNLFDQTAINQISMKDIVGSSSSSSLDSNGSDVEDTVYVKANGTKPSTE